MNGDLKELLFGQLQGLTRSYQSSVTLMSTYQKEVDRLEKELASEREARAKSDADREALVADREALVADHAALVADHAALVADHAALAEALVRQEPDADDDPLDRV